MIHFSTWNEIFSFLHSFCTLVLDHGYTLGSTGGFKKKILMLESNLLTYISVHQILTLNLNNDQQLHFTLYPILSRQDWVVSPFKGNMKVPADISKWVWMWVNGGSSLPWVSWLYGQGTQGGCSLAVCTSPAWPVSASPVPCSHDWPFYILAPGLS